MTIVKIDQSAHTALRHCDLRHTRVASSSRGQSWAAERLSITLYIQPQIPRVMNGWQRVA